MPCVARGRRRLPGYHHYGRGIRGQAQRNSGPFPGLRQRLRGRNLARDGFPPLCVSAWSAKRSIHLHGCVAGVGDKVDVCALRFAMNEADVWNRSRDPNVSLEQLG